MIPAFAGKLGRVPAQLKSFRRGATEYPPERTYGSSVRAGRIRFRN